MRDRRGNTQHFAGVCMQLSGADDTLDAALTDFDFVNGMEITGRRDTDPGCGILFLLGSRFARRSILEIARKHGLWVVGA